MAPIVSPILAHSSSRPSSRHLYSFHHQIQRFSHGPPRQSLASDSKEIKLRGPDGTLQLASPIPEGPSSPPLLPTPSDSAVPDPNPSAMPGRATQPQGPNPLPGDVPGNIVAAVVLIVLILGGLIGLIVGGEILRRRAKVTGKQASSPPSNSGCLARRKCGPKNARNTTELPQQRTKASREKISYAKKISNQLTRPPPVFNRERQRRLPGMWPIHNLSRALGNHRSRHPEKVERSVERSPSVASPRTSPQTTWDDFVPVSPYVTAPRTVLSCILEEIEDYESQSDVAVLMGVTLRRSPEPESVVSNPHTNQPKSSHTVLSEGSNGPRSPVTTERCGSQDCQTIHQADDDSKSLGSSAPDMTSDGDESSRSSIGSLESLEGENDRESLREEAYELRRAQTRSMQMNKGVLLSLSLKTLGGDQDLGSAHGEPESPVQSPSTALDGKDSFERGMSLAMLGGSFSTVSLDEFPSPPSILPMIPSLVSGF